MHKDPHALERPAGAAQAQDARIRLEGRVEVMEAAGERYRELTALVGGLQWKRRLRERPEALQAVSRQEAALEEVLLELQHKAQAEQWPPAFPVLATMRATHRHRARLMARVLRRLGRTRAQVSGLEEALGRLDTLARAGPFRPAPGEVCLCAGRSRVWTVPFPMTLGLVLGSFVGTVLLGMRGGLIPLGVLAASTLATRLRHARYWLTSERLVWQPPSGEARQIPLGAIASDGLVLPLLGGVRVTGAGETLTLHLGPGIPSPERLSSQGRDPVASVMMSAVGLEHNPSKLASMLSRGREQSRFLSVLELRRRAPLLGGAASEPLTHALCAPALLYQGEPKGGVVVLRPGYIAFFALEKTLEVLRSVTPGAGLTLGDGSELDMLSLLEQLSYLPTEAAFDAIIERAVGRAGGKRWTRNNLVRQNAQRPLREGLRFHTFDPPHPAWTLTFHVDPHQEAAAERILALAPNPLGR